MQQRKALKTQPRCTQQPDYAVARLPEMYRKPLSWGHLAIADKMLVPNGVRYRGVPLYSHRMIDLSTVRNRMDIRLRLNRAFHSDLECWCQLLSLWNGVSILAPFHREAPDGLITSDASGRWGCGAFHELDWFQLK